MGLNKEAEELIEIQNTPNIFSSFLKSKLYLIWQLHSLNHFYIGIYLLKHIPSLIFCACLCCYILNKNVQSNYMHMHAQCPEFDRLLVETCCWITKTTLCAHHTFIMKACISKRIFTRTGMFCCMCH